MRKKLCVCTHIHYILYTFSHRSSKWNMPSHRWVIQCCTPLTQFDAHPIKVSWEQTCWISLSGYLNISQCPVGTYRWTTRWSNGCFPLDWCRACLIDLDCWILMVINVWFLHQLSSTGDFQSQNVTNRSSCHAFIASAIQSRRIIRSSRWFPCRWGRSGELHPPRDGLWPFFFVGQLEPSSNHHPTIAKRHKLIAMSDFGLEKSGLSLESRLWSTFA